MGRLMIKDKADQEDKDEEKCAGDDNEAKVMARTGGIWMADEDSLPSNLQEWSDDSSEFSVESDGSDDSHFSM